jgi:predicted transcriptional regulator
MSKLSAKQKMLNTLTKSEGFNTFTVASARNRFGVENVSARIHELREEGYPIYTNRKTLADGRKISFYRMGKPSKEVVAAGYRALREKNVRTFA